MEEVVGDAEVAEGLPTSLTEDIVLLTHRPKTSVAITTVLWEKWAVANQVIVPIAVVALAGPVRIVGEQDASLNATPRS